MSIEFLLKANIDYCVFTTQGLANIGVMLNDRFLVTIFINSIGCVKLYIFPQTIAMSLWLKNTAIDITIHFTDCDVTKKNILF